MRHLNKMLGSKMTYKEKNIVDSVFDLICKGYGSLIMVGRKCMYSIIVPGFENKDVKVEFYIQTENDHIKECKYSLENHPEVTDKSRLVPEEYIGIHIPEVSNTEEMEKILSTVYQWLGLERDNNV